MIQSITGSGHIASEPNYKYNSGVKLFSLFKKNVLAVPFLLLFVLPFLIAIGLLTGYSNKQIVIKNRAAETTSLTGFAIYKTFSNLPNPEFRLEKNKAFLLGADSGIFVSTAEEGVGLVQMLPEKLEVPLILKAKFLVVSGRVHFSLVDDRGREIYAGEVKAENKWQELSAEILSGRFAEEEFKLKEIRIYAADQNTSWYINNVSLNNFDQQREQTSLSGTFAPIPPPYNLRVMLIALNPMENGENLVDHFQLGGSMSASAIEDTLTRNIISDFQQLSHNTINYQVVKKINISTFPQYLNGFTYDFAKYSQCLAGDPGGVCERQKFFFDHIRWVRDNRICEIADSERIDAIWLIDPAYLTTWENFMIGPNGGFNVNGGFYTIPECKKHYIINTANYVMEPNNLRISHVFGHAVEWTMQYYVSSEWSIHDKNRFLDSFTQFDFLRSQPSGADVGPFPQTFCGNIHWPANGRRRYDYGNYTYKAFSCSDWKNFPFLKAETESINCEKWGCSGGSKWETYWLSNLPDYWWSFLLLPDETIRYRRAGAPIPYPTLTPTPTIPLTITPTATLTPTTTPLPALLCDNQCYFGKGQCETRASRKEGYSCLVNRSLCSNSGCGQDATRPDDWCWANCKRLFSTPTATPTLIPTPTPSGVRTCVGQYFGYPQCDTRANKSKPGSCQLNPALGTINPSNPDDPINYWKWSYCK